MSSKMSMSFFLQFLMKTFQDFLHIMDFNGVQTVQGPKDNFSANCTKGFKRHQTMNKGLIKDPPSHDSKKDSFILMNDFEQESHERASQNRARRAFELIKLKLCHLFIK